MDSWNACDGAYEVLEQAFFEWKDACFINTQHQSDKGEIMVWINVKKRLPSRGKIVLVTNGEQVGLGFHGFGSGKTKITCDNVYWMRPVALDPLPGITHWQSLPKPPRKRKQE